jgi:hypothetical protein
MTQYIINDQGTKTGNVNVLPVTVNFNGEIPNGSKYWEKQNEEKDGCNAVNFLRGRELQGTKHIINGHTGVLFIEDSKNNYQSILKSDSMTLYEHQKISEVGTDQLQRVCEWVAVADLLNE